MADRAANDADAVSISARFISERRTNSELSAGKANVTAIIVMLSKRNLSA